MRFGRIAVVFVLEIDQIKSSRNQIQLGQLFLTKSSLVYQLSGLHLAINPIDFHSLYVGASSILAAMTDRNSP